jgi:hypothetical protein
MYGTTPRGWMFAVIAAALLWFVVFAPVERGAVWSAVGYAVTHTTVVITLGQEGR